MVLNLSPAQPTEEPDGPITAALRHLVVDLKDLISSSGGVYGLHMNDDPAPWDSLLEGGAFEGWLAGLAKAEALLATIDEAKAARAGMDAEERRQWDEAFAKQDAVGKERTELGLKPVPGCICFGGNTPELLGECPCQGVKSPLLGRSEP